MKAIFLDIDGVLNNTITGGIMFWNSTLPHCIDNLNNIVDVVEAKVFIISTWVDESFFNGDNKKLENFLYERGVRQGSIIGFRKNGMGKEDGIKELIQEFTEIENFIIIDDNPEIISNSYFKTRHIKPESLVGLTIEQSEQAIQMLNE